MKKYVEPKAQIIEYVQSVLLVSDGEHNIQWDSDWYSSQGEGM